LTRTRIELISGVDNLFCFDDLFIDESCVPTEIEREKKPNRIKIENS